MQDMSSHFGSRGRLEVVRASEVVSRVSCMRAHIRRVDRDDANRAVFGCRSWRLDRSSRAASRRVSLDLCCRCILKVGILVIESDMFLQIEKRANCIGGESDSRQTIISIALPGKSVRDSGFSAGSIRPLSDGADF